MSRLTTSSRGVPRRKTTKYVAASPAAGWQALCQTPSSITTAVLRSTDDDLGVDERIDAWAEVNAERVERARTTVRAALDRDTVDLATLSVALRVLRGLPG